MELSVNLIIIIVTGIISFATFNNNNLMNRLIFWPHQMRDNVSQYYRFITSGLIHADMTHLIFNMFTLFFFGNFVEKVMGSIQYLLFYIAALIISSITTFLKHKTQYHYRSLGASGAVTAVLFACIYIAPWNSIYLMAILPIPAILYAVIYLAYTIRMAKNSQDNINHDAHLYGAIFGFLYMLLFVDPTHGLYFIEKLKSFDFKM